MTRALLLAGGVLAGALLPPAAGAQAPDSVPSVRVSTGVSHDTVTVGDRFRSYVRLAVPPGTRVTFPPVPAGDTLQQVDSLRVVAEAGSGAAAVYPLTAWTAGATPVAAVTVRVREPGGADRVYRVPLRLPFVRSVLPADTTGLRPKPARPPLPLPGPGEARRLWVLVAAVLLALLAIFWLYRRWPRRPPPVPSPREAALAELVRLRASGLVEAGRFEAFYTAVVRVVRRYMAAIEAGWGEELTTTELLDAVRGAGLDAEPLAALLRRADPVKFAAAVPDPAAARAFWEDARAWVVSDATSPAPEPAEVVA